MAPNKQLANALFLPHQICPQPIAVLSGCVRLDIWGANAGKSSEHGRRFSRRTHQWLGTFGNPGNGHYRQELKQARSVIATYAHALAFPLSHVVIRLDGLYGNAAPLADLLAAQVGEEEGPAVVVRGKDYHLIEQPAIQQRLRRPPDQSTIHPESGASRALYDCGPVQLAPTGAVVRMLLATHPAGSSRPPVGKVREGVVYEQFFTTLPTPRVYPCGCARFVSASWLVRDGVGR